MRRAIFGALSAVVLGVSLASAMTGPAEARSMGRYEVFGVEGEDMLKLRAGPGLGYVVIVGLPNGAVVRVESCQLVGGTSWCKVSLDQARALRGYVSGTYLKKI